MNYLFGNGLPCGHVIKCGEEGCSTEVIEKTGNLNKWFYFFLVGILETFLKRQVEESPGRGRIIESLRNEFICA